MIGEIIRRVVAAVVVSGVTAISTITGTGTPPPGTGSDQEDAVVLVAAGDIACDPRNPAFERGKGTATLCRQADVADLIATLEPDVVMPLGDTQYDHGQLSNYRASYGPSWGRFLDRTLAVVGNHEYETPGAKGFFRYFKAAAGPGHRGYYSTDVGAWHVVVLNSNCWVESCQRGSAQIRWLEKVLASHPAACTLAAWHHPRWSSGEHGDDASVAPFLRVLGRSGVDIILNGHDHHYERFRPRSASGTADPHGFRQFIVGTGGAEIYGIGAAAPLSEVRRDVFGVLALTLEGQGYSWAFETIAGETADRGSGSCGS